MKAEIKECKPSGTGGHITMEKADIGKKFLVLPEDSKYILLDILKRYHEALGEHVNPKLKEFLTSSQFKIIKQVYKKKIDKIDKIQHKDFLKSNYDKLEDFKMSDIGKILNDIEDNLPKSLRENLLGEYYRARK